MTTKAETIADELVAAVDAALESGRAAGLEAVFAKHAASVGPLDLMSMTLHACWSGRLRKLEARIEELEGKGLQFEGPYTRGAVYRRGAVVISKGSAFVAREITGEDPSTPGTGTKAWALIAQRGRDGKDGKDWTAS